MSYYGFRNRPTPCSGTIMGSSMAECISDCKQGLIDNNDCTSYAINTLTGNGRVCAAGSTGVDGAGNCVPTKGDVKDAYDNYVAECPTGPKDSDLCKEYAETILSKHPGTIDKTQDGYRTACPNGRVPCSGAGPESCARRCALTKGVSHGKLTCEGPNAVAVQGTFRGTSLRNIEMDPTSAYYDAGKAEMKRHYDKQCLARENNNYDIEMSFKDRLEARNLGHYYRYKYPEMHGPIPSHASGNREIVEACRRYDGRRDYQCESGHPRRFDRSIEDEMARRELLLGRQSVYGTYVDFGNGLQCNAHAPYDPNSPCAPQQKGGPPPSEKEKEKEGKEVEIVLDDAEDIGSELVAKAVAAALESGAKISILLGKQESPPPSNDVEVTPPSISFAQRSSPPIPPRPPVVHNEKVQKESEEGKVRLQPLRTSNGIFGEMI